MAKKKSKGDKVDSVRLEMDSTKITSEIAINCSYTDLIPLSDLIPSQGNLKTSKGESLTKLEKSFDAHGFIEPLILWWDSSKGGGKTMQMLAGHQRRKLLYKMAGNGKGTKDLLIPVIYSKAPTVEKAMEILLHLIEQTGDITQDGLIDFAKKHSFSLDEIGAKMSLKSPALSLAKKKLEEQAVAKLQEDPKYPIQAHFSEEYGAVTIFYKNEMDKVWLCNFLKVGKTKDYNSTHVGQTQVISVEHFQEVTDAFEEALRPKKGEKTVKELEARIAELEGLLTEKTNTDAK